MALELTCYLAGEAVQSDSRLEVRNPYNGELVGTVGRVTRAQTEQAIGQALRFEKPLTRFERSQVLTRAAQRL